MHDPSMRRLYYMRCPECGGFDRNYRSGQHLRSLAHKMGQRIRQMVVLEKKDPGTIARELGIHPRKIGPILLRLGITSWKGKKKNLDVRGPRSLVPPQLEELAAERGAAGMMVECAIAGRKKPSRSRIYLNGRRCAVVTAKGRPRNFEDEAPLISLRRPLGQDWEFLIVVTPFGRLVLSKPECPVTMTTVAIGAGMKGVATQNWKMKLEAWHKVKPVKWVKPKGSTGTVTEEDKRVSVGLLPSGEDLDSVAEESRIAESTNE